MHMIPPTTATVLALAPLLDLFTTRSTRDTSCVFTSKADRLFVCVCLHVCNGTGIGGDGGYRLVELHRDGDADRPLQGEQYLDVHVTDSCVWLIQAEREVELRRRRERSCSEIVVCLDLDSRLRSPAQHKCYFEVG